MKHLLFLFISILLSFSLINLVNAEPVTYTNITCNKIAECAHNSFSSRSFGLMPIDTQGRDILFSSLCKRFSNNEESTYLGHSINPGIGYIVHTYDFINFTEQLGNRITHLTCEVPKPKILGCINPEATNYNSQATEDDGSCTLSPPPPQKIPGCTNPQALNYNPQATEDNGTCIEKIEGCTDSTALNYNPNANVHKESLCQYPPAYTPQDITGAFEKSQVSIGATTWTLRFNLNVPDASLDFNNIQTWNKFKAISATTNDKTITLTLRQFDDQRLNVECTNYEVTIPRRALVTPQGDTNPNPISGNFEVVECPEKPQDQTGNTEDEENNQAKHENTIKEDNFYLSLYDTDENGKVYINLTNVIYILGFISFFLVLFFVLFGFIKNSFLGKSRKSYR